MKEWQDAELLDLLRSAKTRERGFRLLIETHQERLYWHVRRMVTDHSDADDVLQNTFIKAFKGIARFKGKSKLYTWLYRIATNEAITFLQKRNRRNTLTIDDEEQGLSERLTADPFFDGDEVQAKLMAAVDSLPAKQKAVFNLRYFDEMSYKEISGICETSVGALKASYHHAVKKIEAFFKQAEV